MVTAHGRAIRANTRDVTAVAGDIREPLALLSDPGLAGLIDFGEPVAVLCIAMLHFIPDEVNLREIISALRRRMAPGSYLALSHAISDGAEESVVESIASVYDEADGTRCTTHREAGPGPGSRAGAGRTGPGRCVAVEAGQGS